VQLLWHSCGVQFASACTIIVAAHVSILLLWLGPVADVPSTAAAAAACSYGSFMASRLNTLHKERIHGLCLIDPVCLGM
jgi:pimeloyl-ACP methyl ester carboxylesterase